VLVADVPDELLDDVFERDDARGPAVLVDHDGHLEAERAELDEKGSEVHGLRHARGVHHERGGRDLRAPCVRDPDRAAQVHEAHDVVARVTDHREPRVTGLSRALDDVGRGRVPPKHDEPGPVRHDVDRREPGKLERVRQQRRGRLVEGADLRGTTHEGHELLRGPASCELLARLDTRPAEQTVRAVVEEADHGS